MLNFVYLLAATGATIHQETDPIVGPPPVPVYADKITSVDPRATPRVLVGKERLAVPTGNPGLWVNTDDYPPIALRQKWEGVTAFRVTVGVNGRVSACEITVSSGHAVLDAATCRYITERAVFSPARDRKGKAIADIYENRVRWQIPNDPILAPSPGTTTFIYTIEKDGTVSSCKVTGSQAQDELALCANPPVYWPPVNQNGDPVRKQVVVSTATRVGELTDNR